MSINALAGFVNLYGSQYPAYKLKSGNDQIIKAINAKNHSEDN
jgi:hypothetical protein